MSNNTEFKVESGIQIPPVVRKPYKYPFAEMGVRDAEAGINPTDGAAHMFSMFEPSNEQEARALASIYLHGFAFGLTSDDPSATVMQVYVACMSEDA